MTEQQINKIKGIFFGQAIGDALGLGTEFLNKQQIAKYYPDELSEYSQIVQDAHRMRFNIGAWTDDTDQFLCICDSILAANDVDEIAFAKELYKWFNGNPMGIGRTVLQVVSYPQFTEMPFKASESVWKQSGMQNAANGALMRTSILGAYEFWNPQKVIQNTEKIPKVTHWDPRCIGSCVIVTHIISSILNQNQLPALEQIIEIGERYDKRIKPFIEKATSDNISDLHLDEHNSIGYTLKALSAALWAYFNSPDFETGILKIINEGGDADTNACIAGSILGAKYGFNSIPEKYINGLKNKTLLENKFNAFIDNLKERYEQKYSTI
jgi:ADP-ribosylglycohydrolase